MKSAEQQVDCIIRALKGVLYSVQGGGSFDLFYDDDVTERFITNIKIIVFEELSRYVTDETEPLYDMEYAPNIDRDLCLETDGNSVIDQYVSYFEQQMHEKYNLYNMKEAD